jgi:hypothetical protein
MLRQFVCWANGTRYKISPAIGAHAMQFIFYAVCAERALKGANVGFSRFGRQVFVAAFAIRS